VIALADKGTKHADAALFRSRRARRGGADREWAEAVAMRADRERVKHEKLDAAVVVAARPGR